MWRWKKRRLEEQIRDSREHEVRVEVEHHKDRTKEAITEAKEVTDKFNDILKKNGITLKIHIATKRHR